MPTDDKRPGEHCVAYEAQTNLLNDIPCSYQASYLCQGGKGKLFTQYQLRWWYGEICIKFCLWGVNNFFLEIFSQKLNSFFDKNSRNIHVYIVELTGLGGSVDGYEIEHAGTCSVAFSYSIQKTLTEDETGTKLNELEKSLNYLPLVQILNHWFKSWITDLNSESLI